MSISVVIATRNEERIIEDCLESVKWADEIVIVDDKSTDNTVNISKRYTKNIVSNDSNGSFHKNKNLGLEKASGDWILSLDADEIIPDELKDEIIETVSKSDNIDGYYINRRNYFLGKWVKGCMWSPDYILRLFRNGSAKWPLNIHDVPSIEDETKTDYLKNYFIHHSYYSMNQYFEKFNRYTTRLANEESEKGKTVTTFNILSLLIAKPIYWFLKKYIVKRGFLDGFRGLFISLSSACVIFMTYSKLWEIQEK